ncbi:MAG TPA: hypothetical protein PKE69_06230 [Pyrinomonadaceae bacterium]|nr:hypothetical protein [Pyrinomonadaceae bacterium]
MIKKLLILAVGLSFVALFFWSAWFSANTKSEFLGVINELDGLTDKSVEIIGNQPTLASVNEAKLFIDGRKAGIIEKIRGFRNEGRLREKSNDDIQLGYAAEDNKNKIAKVYDDFVDKAKNDIRSLDEEKERLLKANKKLSNADIDNLEQKSKLIEENIDVVKALDNLMTSYETIFENK